jgi:lipid-A-disaccharide synthase
LKKSVLIVAGEPSGDNVGGLFAAELKLLRPDFELFGLGGDRMDVSGVEIRYHIDQLSFLGFLEIIRHIPFMKRVERDLLDQAAKRKPSLAVLIDYPGFNLRIAGKLREMGIPIMYYVSPQVWAWGKKRIKRIKRLVDLMVVVFEFEKNLYEKSGLPVRWFGHPLLEVVKPRFEKAEFLTRMNMSANEQYIGIFPGSRKQELERILPVMRQALDIVNRTGLNLKGVVGCVPGIDDEYYRRLGGDSLAYVRAAQYDLMKYSELNLVASGTATLECAILGRPLFVLYKTSLITYLIARTLVKIPDIGLVNVVAGERIVPEFIQGRCKSQPVADAIIRFFSDEDLRSRMLNRLSSVRGLLGQEGASRKAAESSLEMLDTGGN